MGNIMEIFKKHSALISSTHRNLTLTQKKALNVLYKGAQTNLKAGQELGKWHIIDFETVRNLLGIKKGNTNHLKEELWRLTSINVEYNIFEKDKKVWGKFGLLQNDLKTEINEEGQGIFKYKLAEIVEENLIKPNVFAKIDLSIIKEIKSKYAVILYEILEDYKKVNIPKMTIQEFRELMGIEEDKYKQTANLKAKVIEVIKKEINEKTNFSIDYFFEKKAQKIIGIQWQIIDYDESKQEEYFKKMEFINYVRATYKKGDLLYDMSETNGTKLLMGANGMLAKKYNHKAKPETVKKNLAENAWTWLYENQNLMQKPQDLFRI